MMRCGRCDLTYMGNHCGAPMPLCRITGLMVADRQDCAYNAARIARLREQCADYSEDLADR